MMWCDPLERPLRGVRKSGLCRKAAVRGTTDDITCALHLNYYFVSAFLYLSSSCEPMQNNYVCVNSCLYWRRQLKHVEASPNNDVTFLTSIRKTVVPCAHVMIFSFLYDTKHEASKWRGHVIEEGTHPFLSLHAVPSSVVLRHSTESK